MFFQPAGREPQKYAVMFKGNEVGIGSGQDFQPGCGEDSGIPGNGFPDFLAGVIFRWRLRFLLEGGIMRGGGGFIFI